MFIHFDCQSACPLFSARISPRYLNYTKLTF
ncbi:MAG: hypothetical protein [Siphoviridae sp. cttb18]|nr:MAG: hypothetical protein [Siphoviridae sp. cttb18]